MTKIAKDKRSAKYVATVKRQALLVGLHVEEVARLEPGQMLCRNCFSLSAADTMESFAAACEPESEQGSPRSPLADGPGPSKDDHVVEERAGASREENAPVQLYCRWERASCWECASAGVLFVKLSYYIGEKSAYAYTVIEHSAGACTGPGCAVCGTCVVTNLGASACCRRGRAPPSSPIRPHREHETRGERG